MDGEVGAQVAAPLFIPHPLPGRRFHEPPSPLPPLGKKRDLPWPPAALHHHPPPPSSPPQHRLMGAALAPNPSGGANWDPNMWEWDRLRFVASPAAEAERQRTRSPDGKVTEDEGENLTLRLGGGSYAPPAPAEELPEVVRPSKRVRSGSPAGGGGGGSYPMCQVDDCRADLSKAKDYHRRHKVCELHSKTTNALVAKQPQRFCQQCSRFHLLSEFDEGKRSCRRRLAGHNRRRRKTQPEDAASRVLLPGNGEKSASGGVDIVNLLTILARLQGSMEEKIGSLPSLPDKDRLIQILRKLNSLPTTNPSLRLPIPGGLDLNVSQTSQHHPLEQVPKANGHASASSTMDLLAVLSTPLAASPSVTQASLSQGSSYVSGNDKAKTPCAEPAADVSHNKSGQKFSLIGGRRGSCALETSLEVSQRPVNAARPGLPLQLFGSADDDSPPKLGSSRKYLSSESSNPLEERSPPSSPPIEQRLFPLHSTMESTKHDNDKNIVVCREENSRAELSMSHLGNGPLELFKSSERLQRSGAVQGLHYQAGYVSSSGSDHSPSSSNSDAQDRTGRIIFKLFDKDPSSLPVALRSQILNWLSHIPSEMESYIRPGCVVLSVYMSMPSVEWDELEDNLLQRVNSLLQCADSEFWRNTRFLVRTNKQLASHKDGKIRICKSWRTWGAPELTSVSPVAVVGGKQTSLALRGRNLTVPGTKIHCTYRGGYTSKEILGSAYPGTIYDDSSLESFTLPAESPKVIGRYFIEVENGFKGNSFPVIIADATICQELRGLEFEIQEDLASAAVIQEDQVQDYGQPTSRDDALHFLNELGWLFQRRCTSASTFLTDFSTTRFKFVLAFSVERDWPALVRTLLDMLVESSSIRDSLYEESMEMLLEVHLLSRAVKRKCRKMVDLLINYFAKINDEGPKVYLFPPNLMGPGGVTPLHLAASNHDSEDIVDALTNDPQEIGLNCWNSIRDENGYSPYMYASMRHNHLYNQLVARKIADRKNGQISVMVGGEESKTWRMEELHKPANQGQHRGSCARCALMESRGARPSARMKGLLQRPYVHSLLAIAAVCVCVCLLFRGSPQIGSVAPFKWENLDFGPR